MLVDVATESDMLVSRVLTAGSVVVPDVAVYLLLLRGLKASHHYDTAVVNIHKVYGQKEEMKQRPTLAGLGNNWQHQEIMPQP